MNFILANACIRGLERLTAWSDVLDEINVFPVADGDTGRNLITSLTPLRERNLGRSNLTRRLMLSARGNSGNIAVGFVSGFIAADSLATLPEASRSGMEMARKAIAVPLAGTMLTVMESLVAFLDESPGLNGNASRAKLVERLVEAVHSTHEQLPELKKAGVVDAGALGIFLFLEGVFAELAGEGQIFTPIQDVFRNRLSVLASYRVKESDGYCIDALLRPDTTADDLIHKLKETGSDVVTISGEDTVKVHLHTRQTSTVRNRIETMGDILDWQVDDLGQQTADFASTKKKNPIHIMTDAAGSISRKDAREFGITLLASYISAAGRSLPETEFLPMDLYALMSRGVRATTSQASVFEREQHYQQVLSRYERVLYLCVGSVYTGNFGVASAWQAQNDPDGRMSIIDTGAASGRLAIIVLETARYARQIENPYKIMQFARTAVNHSREYVFLDRLKYLAAGGRLSKTSAVFGDLLHIKPIISPRPDGARKIGSVKNRKGQLAFVRERIAELPNGATPRFLMLEYSDNQQWIEEEVAQEVREMLPNTEIKIQPLSLTSGVHMGPGTWGVAFMAENPHSHVTSG